MIQARIFSAVLVLPLVACGVGNVPGGGNPAPSSDPDSGTSATTGRLAGNVTSDLALSGDIELTESATIAEGVIVTIAAGSTITADAGVAITVFGTLDIQGTAGERTTIHPSTGPVVVGGDLASAWTGITVESGGSASLDYVDGSAVASLMFCKSGAALCRLSNIRFNTVGKIMVTAAAATVEKSQVQELSNGGATVQTGGSLSIVDSRLFTSTHDIVVATGGALIIDHSEIGGAQGSYEHCNLHIGSADSVNITYSNINSGVYGVMIGGTEGAVFNYNNFEANETADISEVGTVANIDLTMNFWDKGAPSLGGSFDTSSPMGSRVAEAGPRVSFE